VFCGRHLLASQLRRSNIDASAGSVDEIGRIVRRIRAGWPRVRILLRADSGFAREALMAWCEANRVDYLFGLARNERLTAEIAAEMQAARVESETTGKPADASATSPGRRWTAGAVRVASSARPSGRVAEGAKVPSAKPME
jgi:Transposase DDE domain group 1